MRIDPPPVLTCLGLAGLYHARHGGVNSPYRDVIRAKPADEKTSGGGEYRIQVANSETLLVHSSRAALAGIRARSHEIHRVEHPSELGGGKRPPLIGRDRAIPGHDGCATV
jgi:hypothetical protein